MDGGPVPYRFHRPFVAKVSPMLRQLGTQNHARLQNLINVETAANVPAAFLHDRSRALAV